MSEFSIAVNSYEDACELSLILLKNDYVTMISREESLYIVSAIWSKHHATVTMWCLWTNTNLKKNM